MDEVSLQILDDTRRNIADRINSILGNKQWDEVDEWPEEVEFLFRQYNNIRAAYRVVKYG